jgi:iodotyrosine deiodinase
MQPWHFVVVSDPEVKRKIRVAAEEEDRIFYQERAPKEWLDALAPLGTDEHKPYLETAPYLIVVFAETHSLNRDGHKVKNYYVMESVGIATGMLMRKMPAFRIFRRSLSKKLHEESEVRSLLI